MKVPRLAPSTIRLFGVGQDSLARLRMDRIGGGGRSLSGGADETRKNEARCLPRAHGSLMSATTRANRAQRLAFQQPREFPPEPCERADETAEPRGIEPRSAVLETAVLAICTMSQCGRGITRLSRFPLVRLLATAAHLPRPPKPHQARRTIGNYKPYASAANQHVFSSARCLYGSLVRSLLAAPELGVFMPEKPGASSSQPLHSPGVALMGRNGLRGVSDWEVNAEMPPPE